jgi:small subunit ribosomal protein S3
MLAGAKGVKLQIGGRLGGSEIARVEKQREGRIPLTTLRAEIDYGTAEAHTTYGLIGVKAWIYRGDKFLDATAEAPPPVRPLVGSSAGSGGGWSGGGAGHSGGAPAPSPAPAPSSAPAPGASGPGGAA